MLLLQSQQEIYLRSGFAYQIQVVEEEILKSTKERAPFNKIKNEAMWDQVNIYSVKEIELIEDKKKV